MAVSVQQGVTVALSYCDPPCSVPYSPSSAHSEYSQVCFGTTNRPQQLVESLAVWYGCIHFAPLIYTHRPQNGQSGYSQVCFGTTNRPQQLVELPVVWYSCIDFAPLIYTHIPQKWA